MYRKEICCKDMDQIDLAYDSRVAGCCEHGNEALDSIECGELQGSQVGLFFLWLISF